MQKKNSIWAIETGHSQYIKCPLEEKRWENSRGGDLSESCTYAGGNTTQYSGFKLEIERILLTMVDNRTNYARGITALLIETYGGKVRIFENSIPMSVRAAETSAEGISIYQHDSKGRGAGAYQSLTEEVLGTKDGKEIKGFQYKVKLEFPKEGK